MAKSEWLSIDEISRLWGEETGEDAVEFKKDLERWFSDFVKQSPSSQSLIAGKSADTTNRLMGMLGARYLERGTFEAYCKERKHPLPTFWFGAKSGWVDRDQPSSEESSPDDSVPDESVTVESAPDKSDLGEFSPGESSPGDSSSDELVSGATVAGGATNPELEAFQSQIANMSERLKVPSFEYPSGRSDPAAGPRQPAFRGKQRVPTADQDDRDWLERELSARAKSAEAEARGLEAQLEAAERKIAELSAAPPTFAQDAPHAPGPGASARDTSLAHSPAGYRTPSDTSHLLRQGARRRRPDRLLWAGIIAIPVIALVSWGAVTVLQPGGERSARTATGSTLAPTSPGSAEQSMGLNGGDATALSAAQQQIARLTAAVEIAQSDSARLRDELAIARQDADRARRTRPAASEPADTEASGLRAALKAAEQKTAALEAELNTARDAAADARGEAERLRAGLQEANSANAAKLKEMSLAATAAKVQVAAMQRELATARQELVELNEARDAALADAESLRATMEEAEAQSDAARQELTQDLTASSDERAALREELAAAQLKIENLSAAAETAENEVARLKEELAARERNAGGAGTSSSLRPDTENTEESRDAAETAAETTAATDVSRLLDSASETSDSQGGFEQVAALTPTEPAPRTDAVSDTITPNELLREPGRSLGQEVVVTGSVVWLLWRYRLQSDSGSSSMVVDVDDLSPEELEDLEQAIERVGILGQVRARIRGTVVRKGEDNYRLAASEVVLLK